MARSSKKGEEVNGEKKIYEKKTNKQTNNEAKQQQKEEKERIKLSVEPARPGGGGDFSLPLY